MTVPLTGPQHDISAGGYHATITGLGAGLRELRHGDQALIATYDPDELAPHSAGQLLAPWPNRVDGGRYRFGGAEHQLALSEPANGNAIHGLTREQPWQQAERGPDLVALRCQPIGHQGFPFCLEVMAEYRLHATDGLTVTITATNRGSRPAPWGTGSHPYLTPAPLPVDDFELTLPAARRLPSDDRGIPSGPPEDVTGTEFDFREPRKVGATRIDHAFTSLERDSRGRAWVRCSAGGTTIGVWADGGYGWLQVYTSDGLGPDANRRQLAVEPMTCPPNAFASGEDLVTLRPGESVTQSWGITTLLPNG